MNFADRLNSLPSIDHLVSLDLIDPNKNVVATIENKPGKAGSLRLYNGLAAKHGGLITPAAAAEGIEWFAEHTEDARANPGKHPNIDRLIEWAAGDATYSVKLHSTAA
ncbi:DUF2322 family protein [Hydrogenophaga sp. 5NK40-0174]|uniref:DUF2322 family protein n=1 Tax=Hydrogenophaga sp. 5NK40-0174 TaxID=3127649 RepID=UPI003340E810